MIWADRIGLVLAILAGLFWLSNQKTDPELVFILFAIGPWLALRALDFIVTGAIRIPREPSPPRPIPEIIDGYSEETKGGIGFKYRG